MEALFRALPALLEALPDNELVREAVIFAAWRRCAGDQLIEHTCLVKFAENRLTVAVADKSWQKNLASLSSQMIFKINAVLGSAIVTYIEFVVDTDKFGNAKLPVLQRGQDDSSVQITPDLIRSASAITDERLRREFLVAAANCLARKEKFFQHEQLTIKDQPFTTNGR